MTDDFIQDAIESLQEDDSSSYILIAAHYQSPNCWNAAKVPTREHLEWMKRRFAELCDRLEAQYDSA